MSDFMTCTHHWTVTSECPRCLREQLDALAARLAVLDGSACAEEQSAGNGPCGVCTSCLRARLAEAQEQADRDVIERNRVIAEKSARLAEAEAALASATVDTWWAKAYFEKYPRTPDSASGCDHEWRPYAFHPNGGPASYYCPLCRVNRAPTATEIQKSSVPDQPTVQLVGRDAEVLREALQAEITADRENGA